MTKEEAKAYREAHKEELRTKRKIYLEAHKEEIRIKKKAYYRAHKEEATAYRETHKEKIKAYREAHKEELKAKRKIYNETHKGKKDKEKIKAYYEAHKEERKTYMIKYKYGLLSEQIDKMLVEQNYNCAICKKSLMETKQYIDHDHSTGEVRGILCSRCNPGLAYIEDEEFLRKANLYLGKK